MLTEGAVRDAEPREKTYKLFDTGGLFVMVNPDGSRWCVYFTPCRSLISQHAGRRFHAMPVGHFT